MSILKLFSIKPKLKQRALTRLYQTKISSFVINGAVTLSPEGFMAGKSNFEFLKEHDPVFFQLAFAAEKSFSADPNTTLIKLRQLGEAFAQDMAARCGIEFEEKTSQADLLFKLNREIRLDPNIRDLFHTLRIEGNRATHQFRTQHKEALDGLRLARILAIWFHQAFGKLGAAFKPGPFVAPADPSQPLRDLTHL